MANTRDYAHRSMTFEGVRVSAAYSVSKFAIHMRFEDARGVGYDFLVDDTFAPDMEGPVVEGFLAFQALFRLLPVREKYRYEIAAAGICRQ